MTSSSQRRCVFVGNIPYDATEEQLIDICRDVGPVVSFRLVVDRETGKPKGYGFCEYKDEETALSARRNLQGYEVNGRQLRVDFAENDKNLDRTRDQGDGGTGPGITTEMQKVGGSANLEESSLCQPIGLHIAMTAAAVMSGALGEGKPGLQSSQNAFQRPSALPSDPLSHHLATMSQSQLIKIVSEFKILATQNTEVARQLLLERPLLSKALFQAQIMIGMVAQEVSQIPNIQQPSIHHLPHLFQATMHDQPPTLQTLPGVPHHGQRKNPSMGSAAQDGEVSVLPEISFVPSQLCSLAQPPLMNSHTLIQPCAYKSYGTGNFTTSNLGMQLPFEQHQQELGIAQSSSVMPHLSLSDANFQPNQPRQSMLVGTSHEVDKKNNGFAGELEEDAVWPIATRQHDDMKRSRTHSPQDPSSRPLKLLRSDGTSHAPAATPSYVPQELACSGKQVSQLLHNLDSKLLLQQLLALPPEQLDSLPPEQQHLVFQLQQALCQAPIQQQ